MASRNKEWEEKVDCSPIFQDFGKMYPEEEILIKYFKINLLRSVRPQALRS